jgi:hypothetical protein
VSQVSQTKENLDNPVTLVTDVTVNTTRSTDVNNKPNHHCYTCRSDNWWYSPVTGWLCGTCHPDPNRSS